MRKLLVYPLMLFSSLSYAESYDHVRYLSAKGDISKALEEYSELAKESHNPSALQQICFSILSDGLKSEDSEKVMISLYSLSIARLSDHLPFLRKCLRSKDPNIEMAALYLLDQIHEDVVEDILCEAMSSPYFPIRMEALYRLCRIKSKKALAYLESTKNLIPDEYTFSFPDLYLLIGSNETITSLKKMIASPHLNVKIASILACGQHHRDDFLPEIRLCAKHVNPAEQEVSAFSLGVLSDLQSIEILKQLATSSYSHVALSSSIALIKLGHHEYEKTVYKLALDGDPFAVYALKNLPFTQTLLYELVKAKEPLISLNATLALLFKKDPACIPTLLKLFTEFEYADYTPIFSPGHTLFAWKPIAKISLRDKNAPSHLSGLSLQFLENTLISSLDLPEKDFFALIEYLLEKDCQPLIPLAIRLLENTSSDEGLRILQKNAQKPGNPLIRDYCLLSLFRLDKDENAKKQFLERLPFIQSQPIIQFRPIVDRASEKVGGRFELTPEEHSRLLLETCEALAIKKDVEAIDQIVLALKKGHPDNRPALAGILLNALH